MKCSQSIEEVTAEEVQQIAQEFFDPRTSRSPCSAIWAISASSARNSTAELSTRQINAGVPALCLLFAASLLRSISSHLNPKATSAISLTYSTPNPRAQLEAYCGRVEQATGVQMALVTLESLDGEPIEDVTNTLFRKWGVGKKGKDEGVMLLLAIKDHTDRIEVGYGLEPILPDGFVGSMLRESRPSLRQGRLRRGDARGRREDRRPRIAAAKGVTLDVQLRRIGRIGSGAARVFPGRSSSSDSSCCLLLDRGGRRWWRISSPACFSVIY